MPVVLGQFPDVEAVLRDLLAPLGARVVTKLGEDEEFTDPVIAVRRTGGSDDGITDRPRVEVICFTQDRHLSQQLAEQVRQTILAHSGKRVLGEHREGGTVIDRAGTDTTTGEVSDRNPDVRRIPATYRLAFRRYTA